MSNYENGPFTINEQIITDDNGSQWVELTLVLTAKVRVPMPDAIQQRQVTLRAENMCLAAMANDVNKALESDSDE